MDLIQAAKEAAGNPVKEALLAVEIDKVVAKRVSRIAAKMSPPGALGLPLLIEQRRLRYGIVDSCFAVQAAYDRILVFQIEPEWAQGETYGSGPIVMTETARRRSKEEAPRGVIVSAGLKALDNLSSNGMTLGHIVHFLRLHPWRLPVDLIDGIPEHLIILRDGDIVGSEDLAASLHAKQSHIIFDVETQEHLLLSHGVATKAREPFSPDDY